MSRNRKGRRTPRETKIVGEELEEARRQVAPFFENLKEDRERRKQLGERHEELRKRIDEIVSDPCNYTEKGFWIFKSSELIPAARKNINELRSQVEISTDKDEAENRSSKIVPKEPSTGFKKYGMAEFFNLSDEYERAKKRDKKKEDKARRDALQGDSRKSAASVKRTLRRDHDCPYCGSVLGDSMHADHIYPVAKGGLSVFSNMVHVCQECNSKKSMLTLRSFCDKFGLNRDVIEQRLLDLGKEV